MEENREEVPKELTTLLDFVRGWIWWKVKPTMEMNWLKQLPGFHAPDKRS